MKLLTVLIPTMLLALPMAAFGEADALTFYVQLVRGTDDATSPVPNARRVGAKLAERFRPVFRWTDYWEIKRDQVSVAHGEKKRVRLSPEREVEVEITQAGKRQVAVYSQGRELCRDCKSVGDPMTIIGGDRDIRSGWFVVVRRDKPSD